MDMQFQVPTKVTFGSGCRNQIVEVIAQNNWTCCAVVVDPALRSTERVAALLSSLEAQTQLIVIDGPTHEPTYDDLEDVRTALNADVAAVIGIGGGSALDVAKAMAVLVHNTDTAISYRGFDKMTAPVVPVIAVPTTAGSGSEVTPNASFVDVAGQMKMGINGEAVRPKFAFLDPELTLSCPLSPTLSSALDSLVHATEAYVAQKSTPIARLLAKEGFTRVVTALPKLVRELDNLSYRESVMYGAFLSGIALMHSGTGPAAALSYPMGVRYGVPHGLGGALFLPEVIALNVSRGVQVYSELLPYFVAGYNDMNDTARADAFVEFMRNLWTEVGAPRSFTDVRVDAIDEQVVTEDTLQLAAALEQNPVSFAEADIGLVLRKLQGASSHA